MAFDGTLKFDTKIDQSGFDGGLKEVEKTSKKSIEEYKKDVMKLAQTYKKQGMTMSDAMKRAYSEIDKSQYAVVEESEKDAHKFFDNWEGAADKLKAAGMIAVKAIGAAFAATGAAMIAFGKQSVQTGMQFDSSMSQVAATMGTTVDQIGELRDFAQEMGATTAFSATQAADALNYMALAGYDAETSMSMLPNVLNLAAAGGMELASASDMITDSQSALGLTLSETSQLVDKMAKASSKSNTSVAQLGEAILTVGGTAKMMAGGTTELTTALGILADNGTKGAEGGTKLRNILLSLGAPTDKAAALLKDLKVSAYDADEKLRPLKDTFGDLNRAMEGMTDAQKTDIINTLFNKTDLKDVNALLATSSERWDELSSAIGNSVGAAQAMADTQLDNLAGDVTLFQSALEGVQIAISDALTPALRDFVQFGSQGLSELTEALKSGDFGAVIDTFEGIFTDGLNMLIEKLPAFMSVGTDILLSLVNGIVTALPTLGTAAFEIINNLAGSISEALPALIPAAYEAVMSFILALTDPNNLGALIDGAIALIMGLADGLIAAMPIMIDNVPIIIQNLVDAIVENAPKLLDAALELILALAEGLITNLPAILEAQGEIMAAILSGLWDFAGTLLGWLGELGGNILSAIGNWFGNLISNVVSFVANVAASVQSFLSDLPNKIGYALGFVIGKIIQFGESALNWATTMPPKIIQSVVTWFMTLPGRLADTFGRAIISVVHFGTSMKEKATSSAKNAAKGIIDSFTSLPGKLADIGGNIVKGLWNGINDMKNWVIAKVKGFGTSVLNGIKNALGIASPSKITKGYGRFLAQGLGIGFAAEMPQIGKEAARMLTAMKLPRPKLGFDFDDSGADGRSSFPIRVDRAAVAALNSMPAGLFGGILNPSPTNDVVNSSVANTYANTNNTYHQTLTFNQPIQTPSQIARATRKALEVT